MEIIDDTPHPMDTPVSKFRKIKFTPEEREKHRVVRRMFYDKPSREQLIANGEISGVPISLVEHLRRMTSGDSHV